MHTDDFSRRLMCAGRVTVDDVIEPEFVIEVWSKV
jgi:hypothetical protein